MFKGLVEGKPRLARSILVSILIKGSPPVAGSQRRRISTLLGQCRVQHAVTTHGGLGHLGKVWLQGRYRVDARWQQRLARLGLLCVIMLRLHWGAALWTPLQHSMQLFLNAGRLQGARRVCLRPAEPFLIKARPRAGPLSVPKGCITVTPSWGQGCAHFRRRQVVRGSLQGTGTLLAPGWGWHTLAPRNIMPFIITLALC